MKQQWIISNNHNEFTGDSRVANRTLARVLRVANSPGMCGHLGLFGGCSVRIEGVVRNKNSKQKD